MIPRHPWLRVLFELSTVPEAPFGRFNLTCRCFIVAPRRVYSHLIFYRVRIGSEFTNRFHMMRFFNDSRINDCYIYLQIDENACAVILCSPIMIMFFLDFCHLSPRFVLKSFLDYNVLFFCTLTLFSYCRYCQHFSKPSMKPSTLVKALFCVLAL